MRHALTQARLATDLHDRARRQRVDADSGSELEDGSDNDPRSRRSDISDVRGVYPVLFEYREELS